MDWQNAKQVNWTPGRDLQPTLEWVRLLWCYLSSSSDDLSVFSKWPILPVGNNHLMQLIRNSNIIEDEGWSENISSLLLKVGCLFLRSDFPIQHSQLKHYVQSATAAGILNALLAVAGDIENIDRLFAHSSEGELQELRNFILQSKWFSEDEMYDIHIEVVKHIPMFESFRSRKLVSLSEGNKWLKPSGLSEDLLDDDFVRAESEREQIILSRYLNIQELSKSEFYKHYVLDRMTDFLPLQKAVSAILCDIRQLVEEDVSVKDALLMTPFVLARNGSWQQPSRLYDPRVPELRLLLHGEVFFPSKEFSDPETLEMLTGLGLKQTLGYDGLLDCARTVAFLNVSRDSETPVYARRLLACLNALGSKLSAEEGQGAFEIFGEYVHSLICEMDWDIDAFLDSLINSKLDEEFWSVLKAIEWCPIYTNPPLLGLPWLQVNNLVAAPKRVRPQSDMWLVSSAMHILNAECYSTYVKCRLGWMDCPEVEVLSTQLVELSKSYALVKSDSDVDPVFDAELQKGVASLYSMMQEFINTQDFGTLKSALEGVSWIWIGDGFVTPNVLAFDSPVKFQPYLYVVPSELTCFRELLLALGVKLSFEASDYLCVLQKLQCDIKGSELSNDQLCFVQCVLEAIADCYLEKPPAEVSSGHLLIPDAFGVLMHSEALVFNDAPWMENNISTGKKFVHPSISNDLATRLGVQSLRSLSLVGEETAKDLACMDFARINELLTLYDSDGFLLFDLLELADCCNTKKLHIIFDKREHPRHSLLQHNLGDFQGPSLLVIFEGASLSREEVISLQFLPPWKLRGDTLNYGLALLSCFSVCDLLSVLSRGYYYIFDPRGSVLAPPSSHSPAAKVFSLSGTNLTERFRDQFSPMFVGQNTMVSSDMTAIRMPLSSEFMKGGPEAGLLKIKQIYDKFMEHGSCVLLSLKSVLQVSLSRWEDGSVEPSEDYSVCVDSSSALLRNPFSEKKWRKFHISRLFSSSSAATKMHVIDINSSRGESNTADRWITVLSMGSGQTRNMALDRRYLAYNLTPIAGIAVHLSHNGHPVDTRHSSCVMSPLPLSASINMPVAILGYFLVRHNRGRYLIKIQQGDETQPDVGNQLIEAWNKELMACVRDSYVEIILEMQKLKRGPVISADELSAGHAVSHALKTISDLFYSMWPRSYKDSPNDRLDSHKLVSEKVAKGDWECIIEHVVMPFYVRVVDLPAWQLYSGNLVRVEEGMFLAQPGNGVGDNVLPATVCNFVKEHYPVFTVPWDLVSEIQTVGITVREIKPKMVRDLLRVSSTSIVVRSVETYVDVLEYCLSDIRLPDSGSSEAGTSVDFGSFPRASRVDDGSYPSMAGIRGLHGISSHSPTSSGVDALEMMSSLGKALFDFGRGVVEDMGKAGGPVGQRGRTTNFNGLNVAHSGNSFLSIAAELRGLPCPTAAKHLARLGVTDLWIGNNDQQMLLMPLSGKFVHLKMLDRPVLVNIFSDCSIQSMLKLHKFSLHLLANHMRSLFHESWVNHVLNSNMSPWFSWENNRNSGDEGGPSPDWIRLFWKTFDGSLDDLPIFSDWPLIPAYLGGPVLCRVKERHLVFVPPPVTHTSSGKELELSGSMLSGLFIDHSPLSETMLPYSLAFREAHDRYPWLLSLLNQCNIPIFDPAFLDCAGSCDCLPAVGQSLGQVIASKLVIAKRAGYFPEVASFLPSDLEELFNFFVSDFSSNGSNYRREELEVLRALPMYKTVVGSCTPLDGEDICVVATNSFLKPYDDCCLSYTMDSAEGLLLQALGVPELRDQQILVRFGLPGFESKNQSLQEDILIYIYMNWQELQVESSVVDVLKETCFVRNADEFSMAMSKPKDLFDPCDVLLMSVFSGERKRFPGERFATDGWLRILRILGLRTAIEADVMLECAKRVEFLGAECIKQNADLGFLDEDPSNSYIGLSSEIWSLAESVTEAVFSNFAVLYSNNFCSAFGKIACIPCERGFPNVGGKRGGKRVLSSYSEAILFKDWPLAWSIAPILSRANVIPPEYSWGALHLQSPPSFFTVLRHLQIVGKDGGGDTLAHWPTAANMMSVEDAACEVLKYLDRVWSSLSSSDVQELGKVGFLPAANGTRLVKANSLFVRLGVNLSPFAFELPALYLPFVRILNDLGLRESLSVASAKDLLINLQKVCGYQRLNPNELRAVLEILHFICDGVDDTRTGSSGRDLGAVVPDDGCRLVHARSCVYIDAYGSRFVKFIDSSRLRFAHPSIPERISLTLGIKKLSEVVQEVFVEDHLQTIESIGSISLPFMREKMLSTSFQGAVFKIFCSVGSSVPAFNDSFSEVHHLLDNVAYKLQFVESIYTRFVLLPHNIDITYVAKGSTIPEWPAGSRHRALYYTDKEKSVFLVAEPPSYISVLDVIAVILSDSLGSVVPLPLGSLFLCPEGSETAVIDILRICSESKKSWTERNCSGMIGKHILSQDARRVQFHPLRPFYMGEIVAWRSQDGEKLRYGRVLANVRPSAGQALYRFAVETAPGVTETLLSSQVFSFRSVSLDTEVSSVTLTENVSTNTTESEIPETSGKGKAIITQQHTGKDLQYGRVSPAELVQAVHEMLSSAGVSMDTEKKTLLSTNLTLQEQLKDSHVALVLEQDKAETATREADTAKAAWQCRVCLTTEVDVAIIPCGHVLCRRCSSAVSRCPFCRLQVSKTMRIFRP